MIKINKIILTVLLFTLVFPIISHGETLDFELNANSTDVEGKLNVQLPVYGTYLNVGAGAIVSDNDDYYWVSNVSAALKDEVLLEALTLGLGFKGLIGQAEVHNEDFNIRSLSFLALGDYDFRKTNIRLPLSLSLSYAMSPSPLNFSDTKIITLCQRKKHHQNVLLHRSHHQNGHLYFYIQPQLLHCYQYAHKR